MILIDKSNHVKANCSSMDLVILYHNGSTPYLKNTQLSLGIKINRFRDNEFFCEFLTSWGKIGFRMIYLVMNDFDNIPKCPLSQIRIIRHSDILEKMSFNSFYIEWHVWKIPDLSNLYMHAHDDMVPTKFNKELCDNVFYINHHSYTATNVLSMASLRSMQMVFEDLICPEVLNGYDHGPQIMDKRIVESLYKNYHTKINEMKLRRSKIDFVYQDVYSVYIRCKSISPIINSAVKNNDWDSRLLYITYNNWDSNLISTFKSWYICLNDDGFSVYRSYMLGDRLSHLIR